MTEKPEPHIYDPSIKPEGFTPNEFNDGVDPNSILNTMDGMKPLVENKELMTSHITEAWDGNPNTIVGGTPQGTTITEETTPDIADPPKECPPAPDATQDAAHKQLLSDPVYAVHLHEKQLDRHAQVLEEIAVRLISLEKTVIDIQESLHGIDPNDPIKNYPEIQMHQNR